MKNKPPFKKGDYVRIGSQIIELKYLEYKYNRWFYVCNKDLNKWSLPTMDGLVSLLRYNNEGLERLTEQQEKIIKAMERILENDTT